MGSSEIYGQISAIKGQIETVGAEIRRLTTLWEEQDTVIRQYKRQKEAYTDSLETQNKIYSQISEFTEINMLAKQYHASLMDDMSIGRRSTIYDSVDSVEHLMKGGRKETEEDLDDKDRELSSLRSQLTQMQAAYQSALQAEEAERQAVAMAAQNRNRRSY